MPILEDLTRELFGLIKAAWPEIVLPGAGRNPTLFTEMNAFARNFVEDAGSLAVRDDVPPPPYAILQIGTERSDPDFGVANRATRFPVSVFYFGLAPALNQHSVRAKLAALRDAIDDPAADFDTFQAVEWGEIDTSADSEINAAILVGASTTFIGGHVRWEPGLLVTED